MKVKRIFGPPGTGKTRTLLELFERALGEGTRPDRVAFLTFTRAAREEAAARVRRPLAELPWLRTIHSACYRALGVTRAQVVARADVRQLGKELGVALSGNVRDPWFSLVDDERELGPALPGDLILQSAHLARHRGVDLAQALPENVQLRYARWLVDAYDAWKSNNGLLDYTDLLVGYVNVGRPLDLDEAIIDEAQDLSWLQWQVVMKLLSGARRLTVAGDDDQAIFSWAGARAELLNELSADETEVLPRSHRLPRQVFELSQRVIQRVKRRTRKEFWPRAADGEVRRVSALSAADLTEDTLVLFRNNHRVPALAQRLEELGVPFTGAGSSLALPAVRDALRAWAAFSRGELVPRELARAATDIAHRDWLTPRAAEVFRAGGAAHVSWESVLLRRPTVENWEDALVRIPRAGYVKRAARRAGGLAALLRPRVRLLSIHQAKGREADTVIVDPAMARRSYEQLWAADADDEHRVWYVAATRARQTLVLLTSFDDKYYSF